MTDEVWISEGTLTLPYGTLRTLHTGVSEVRLYSSTFTNSKQVGKRVSLLGREDTLAVNEAMLLREIDHPNIAKVFDVAEVAGADPALVVVEIVMPYYPEGSLLDAISTRGVRYSAAQARDLVVRALRGLAHLHDEHRVLHRDIKPANLFLSSDESLIKIGDFGEAMRMDDQGTGDPLLTPQYWTPPETFVGSRYSTASDLYSMGMTLRELLSGPLPYDDYTREQLAARLARGHCAVLPRHLNFQPHIPASLRRIVRKATRADSGQRYRSADAMIRELLRARFVDWRWPEAGRDRFVWNGSWQDREYRLTARRVRGKGWRARGERLYSSGWRKIPVVSEAAGEDPLTAAAAVFAQIDTQLTRV